MVQHALQTGLVGLVFGQRPGSGLVDVLVGALDDRKDLHQGLRDGQAVHVGRDLGGQLVDHGLQLGVDGFGTGHIVHGAAEVLLAHGDGAAEQVAQIVRQIAVDAGDQGFVGEHAIVAEGNLTQQEVADGIHAVAVAQDHRVHHIAHGLGHLAAVHQPWPNTRLGSGRSRAISMAGHRMVWKRRISLPTMCRSAGQNLS